MTKISSRRRERRDRHTRNLLLCTVSVLLIVISAFTVGLPALPHSPAGSVTDDHGPRTEPTFMHKPMPSLPPLPDQADALPSDESLRLEYDAHRGSLGAIPPPPPPPGPR